MSFSDLVLSMDGWGGVIILAITGSVILIYFGLILRLK